MASNTSAFLKESVYPRIDAVNQGLLDAYSPTGALNNGAYMLNCPTCGHKRSAYYYKGSPVVHCNRKNNCQSISLWDVLANEGMAPKEIFDTFCELAGVEPPKSSSDTVADNVSTATKNITQYLLSNFEDVRTKFMAWRGFSSDEMDELGYGYYPSDHSITKLLAKKDISEQLAKDKGFIDFRFNKRVVGYWEQPDGSLKLWGRIFPDEYDALKNNGKEVNKYHFSSGLSKTRPYRFKNFPVQICVEGMLDADSLILLGYHACGIGGACINSEQAVYFFKHGVSEAVHLIDNDVAGYNGALTSIRNCESLGITTRIAIPGEGMDDADSMRQKGQLDELDKIIEEAVLGGEFVARELIKEIQSDAKDSKKYRKLIMLRAHLSPASAIAFDRHLAENDVNINIISSALRLYANCIDAGIDVETATRNIENLYNLTISVTTKSDGK